MTGDIIKENIHKRIETLFECSNGEQLFNSMVSLQQELMPNLPLATAQSFVIYGIIKEFQDYNLDKLWFLHTISQSYQAPEQLSA